MSIFHYILIGLEVVLLFNLLIGVHELGHFLAAKWRGLKVDRFAIWFGKPIWKKKVGDVEYALGWIPAGGYVSLPQMATMEGIEGKSESDPQALPPVSPFDKIIVAFAGPLFSFLLAVVFACVVWKVGKPVNETDNSTTIGWVAQTDDSGRPGPAWAAGLRPGDKILEIDGHPVHHFATMSEDSVTWRIVSSEGTNIVIKYLRDNEEHKAYVTPYHRETKWYERKALRQLLIGPAFKTFVDHPITNSPAAVAGLTYGDEIIALDGKPIFSPAAISTAENQMSNGPVKPMVLTVKRGAEQFEKTILPERPLSPANIPPTLGIVWGDETNVSLVYPTPIEQIRGSIGQIVGTIEALTSRHSEIGVQQLGGAVMIVRVYARLFEDEDGWRRVLWFSVILNVNLALLNLLPLPVLDGGHIVLSLIEAIRRRPIGPKLVVIIQNGFMVLLIGFMLYIAFFDTSDWVQSARANHEKPVIFAPHK